MNRAIGDSRLEMENEDSIDGEGDGADDDRDWGRKCGSHFCISKRWASVSLGLLGLRIRRLEKRPPRTIGRFWEGLRWP